MTLTQEQIVSSIALLNVAPSANSLSPTPSSISSGVIFFDASHTPTTHISQHLINLALKAYNLECQLNFQHSFYPDGFNTPQAKSRYALLLDQLHHYTTHTIPNTIDTAALHTSFPSAILHAVSLVSDEMLISLLNNYLVTTAAPAQFAVNHIRHLIPLTQLPTASIKSFEFQCLAHAARHTTPADPDTLLRYIIYNLTNSTLVIKSPELIYALKYSAPYFTSFLISTLSNDSLSQIFLRQKPLFLALRSCLRARPLINRLRRLAKTNHRPLPQLTPATILSHKFSPQSLNLLSSLPPYRLISLYNSILNINAPSHLYSIRNSKSFVAPSSPKSINYNTFMVIRSLINFKLNISGRVFALSPQITLAAPTSDKQAFNSTPWGSYVHLNNEPVSVGVHWRNKPNGERVDIDLHMTALSGINLGWNAAYHDPTITYSGDIVDAPNGASEAFQLTPSSNSYLLSAQLYTRNHPASFDFFISRTPTIYNPSAELLTPTPFTIDSLSSKTLGLLTSNRFYFFGGSLFNAQTPSIKMPTYIPAIQSLLKNRLSLSSLIKMCGAEIYDPLIHTNITPEPVETLLQIIKEAN